MNTKERYTYLLQYTVLIFINLFTFTLTSLISSHVVFNAHILKIRRLEQIFLALLRIVLLFKTIIYLIKHKEITVFNFELIKKFKIKTPCGSL